MLSALTHGWGILALCVEFFPESAKPHSYCREDPKRVQSSGNWRLSKMWHTQKIKALSFPWLHSNYKYGKRKSSCVSLKHSHQRRLEQKVEINKNSRYHWVSLLGIIGLGVYALWPMNEIWFFVDLWHVWVYAGWFTVNFAFTLQLHGTSMSLTQWVSQETTLTSCISKAFWGNS